MRALLFSLVVLLVLPAAAGASTVSVAPYRDPPGTDGWESCARYMYCPPDMLVFTAAAGEANDVTINWEETVGWRRIRFRVSDFHVQAGAGCEQVNPSQAVCIAGTVGPVELGDDDDQIAARQGRVSGGDGDDVLKVASDPMQGDGGDDVLIGHDGDGGAGDDLLMVQRGRGGRGDDVLKCYPRTGICSLKGGSGDDLLTGGKNTDYLFGGPGRDSLRGHADVDELDCGPGRRDRAPAAEFDRVRRCERVRR